MLETLSKSFTKTSGPVDGFDDCTTSIARFASLALAIAALPLLGCTGGFADGRGVPVADPALPAAVGIVGTPAPSATPLSIPSATPTPVPTPLSLAQCLEQTQVAFDKAKQDQLTWYQVHGGLLPTEHNRPVFRKGTNGRAVILVHGFISSPEAMNELADMIAKEGYTIFQPLLTGFAADERAANASTPELWRKSVTDTLSLAKACHTDISLVGHSLGGAVTTDLIANRGFGGTAITHLVLLAPYYKVASGYLRSLLDAFLPFADAITMDEARSVAFGDPYEILGLTRPPEGDPEPFLPLIAGNEVLDYADDFDATITLGKTASPKVLVAASLADSVISGKFAVKYAAARFSTIEAIAYDAQEEIGHSIETREGNPHFDALTARIITHLAN